MMAGPIALEIEENIYQVQGICPHPPNFPSHLLVYKQLPQDAK